jgi:hypothetical protein
MKPAWCTFHCLLRINSRYLIVWRLQGNGIEQNWWAGSSIGCLNGEWTNVWRTICLNGEWTNVWRTICLNGEWTNVWRPSAWTESEPTFGEPSDWTESEPTFGEPSAWTESEPTFRQPCLLSSSGKWIPRISHFGSLATMFTHCSTGLVQRRLQTWSVPFRSVPFPL